MYPGSCAEAGKSDINPIALYWGNDPTKPWQAACFNGQEYLLLNADNNWSQYGCGGPRPGINGSVSATTHFSGVRLDVSSGHVDSADYTMASSVGACDWAGGTINKSAFGVTGDCVSPGSTTGMLNVDLSGTPFAFVANTTFIECSGAGLSNGNNITATTASCAGWGGYCGELRIGVAADFADPCETTLSKELQLTYQGL